MLSSKLLAKSATTSSQDETNTGNATIIVTPPPPSSPSSSAATTTTTTTDSTTTTRTSLSTDDIQPLLPLLDARNLHCTFDSYVWFQFNSIGDDVVSKELRAQLSAHPALPSDVTAARNVYANSFRSLTDEFEHDWFLKKCSVNRRPRSTLVDSKQYVVHTVWISFHC